MKLEPEPLDGMRYTSYTGGCIALIIIWTLITSSASYGQGCSDAGFCTMGAMKPSQIYSKKINFKLRSIEFSYYRGETPRTPVVSAAQVDFTFGINDKTSMQLKLPYQWVKGSFGKTSGLGDISISRRFYHLNVSKQEMKP